MGGVVGRKALRTHRYPQGSMTRILLVTNDFPPRRGGIQSYLEQFVNRLADAGDHQLTVYAPR